MFKQLPIFEHKEDESFKMTIAKEFGQGFYESFATVALAVGTVMIGVGCVDLFKGKD